VIKTAARTDVCSFKVAVLFLWQRSWSKRVTEWLRALLELTRAVESVLLNHTCPWYITSREFIERRRETRASITVQILYKYQTTFNFRCYHMIAATDKHWQDTNRKTEYWLRRRKRNTTQKLTYHTRITKANDHKTVPNNGSALSSIHTSAILTTCWNTFSNWKQLIMPPPP